MAYAQEFVVRFGDVDHARVVYLPRYFHYFHQTFESWFGDAVGVSYVALVTDRNLGFPSVRLDTEFRNPLRYGDKVRVELELAEVGHRSITVRYTAVRLPDEVVAARATIKTVVIDNDTFASVSIPGDVRARLETLQSSGHSREADE